MNAVSKIIQTITNNDHRTQSGKPKVVCDPTKAIRGYGTPNRFLKLISD